MVVSSASVPAAARWRRSLLLHERLHSRFTPLLQQRAALFAKVSAVASRWIRDVFANQSFPQDQVVRRRIHLVRSIEVEASGLGGPIRRIMTWLRVER